MAKYTIELYKLIESENFELFDFDYNLYDNSHKPIFEQFFKDYFYFNEIGTETIGRFKKMLQIKLNTCANYYKEYYKTCLEVEERDMMQTKEIIETMEREINGIVTSTGTNTNIFSATPKQSIANLEKYMTSANKDSATSESENIGTEKTTFQSKGNLGVSSDGIIKEKWREVIVDINKKICEDELRELFMLLY